MAKKKQNIDICDNCGEVYEGEHQCSKAFVDNCRNVYMEEARQLLKPIEEIEEDEEDRDYGDKLDEADYYNNYFEGDF